VYISENLSLLSVIIIALLRGTNINQQKFKDFVIERKKNHCACQWR